MSKGGSTSTETSQQIPAWLEDAAKAAVSRSQDAAGIGYVPYQGPQVAAFTPMQDAAFAGTNAAASAYGLPTSQGNGMPAPTTYAGGMQGYSSYPMYQQELAALKQSNPAQYAALTSMFPQPVNGGGRQGQGGGGQGGGRPQEQAYRQVQDRQGGSSFGSMMNAIKPGQMQGPQQPSQGFPGGYAGIQDMINGGGPGTAGDTYQGGGLLSSYANFRTSPFGSR